MAKKQSKSKLNIPRTSMALVGFVFISFAVFYFMGSGDDEHVGSARVGRLADVVTDISKEDAIGDRATPDMQKRIQKFNNAAADQARDAGESFVPILTVGKPPVTEQPKPKPIVTETYTPENPPPAAPPKPKPRYPSKMNSRERKLRDREVVDAMRKIQARMALGKPAKFITLETKPIEKEEEAPDANQTALTTPEEPAVDTAQKLPEFLTPGTTLFVVNEFEANSDVPTRDIMFRLVAPYSGSGAKLFGRFANQDESMVVEVTTAVHEGKTYSFRGLAVSPETASSNVATDVDTHFWTKQAAYFVATLAEGAAEMIKMAGSTSNVSGDFVTVTKDKVSAADVAIGAIGNTGSRMASSFESSMNRPTTVKLAAGTELAVIVMTDQK